MPGRLRREGHRREDAPGDDAGPRQRPRRDRQDLARAGARLRPGHEDRQGPGRGPGAGRRRHGRDPRRQTGADGVLLREWDKPQPGRPPRAPTNPDPPAASRSRPAAEPQSRAEAPPARPHLPQGRSATWSSTAATSPARAWASPTRSRRGSRRGPTSTPTGPAYRPGQEVALRGRGPRGRGRPVRQRPGRDLPARGLRQPGPAVRRPAGEALGVRHVPRVASPLDEAAPVGTYRVRLFQPGKSEFAGAFEVQAYQLEKIDLAFDLPQDRLLPGRDDQGRRSSPSTSTAPRWRGRPIAVALPDGRTLAGQDRRRRASTRSSSRPTGSPRSRRCGWSPGCRRTTSRSAAAVMLAVRGLPHRPDHDRATSTSTASRSPLEPTTLDAQGEPTGQDAVGRRPEAGRAGDGQVTEREVRREDARRPTPKTGKGSVRAQGRRRGGGRVRRPRRGHRPVRQPGRRRAGC